MSRHLRLSRSSNSGSISARGNVFVDGPPLREDGLLKVIMVSLMERPLSGLGGVAVSMATNRRGLLGKHLYLTIEYRKGQFIRAEKAGDSSTGANDAGIHIQLHYVPSQSRDAHNSDIRFQAAIDLRGLGCRLQHVLDILENHNADYGVLKENCWKYAFSSTESLLRWAKDMAVNPYVQEKLEQDLYELQNVELVTPADLGRALLHPDDYTSQVTIAKYQRRLYHSQLELPKHSLRRSLMSGISKFLDRY